jgi:hypothetical protein
MTAMTAPQVANASSSDVLAATPSGRWEKVGRFPISAVSLRLTAD